MKLSTAKRRINKTLDELCKSVVDDWYANFKNGYIKGYEDARQGKSPMYAETYKVADTPQTETKVVGYCNECKWFRNKQVCGRCRSKNLFAEADTPQTDCESCEHKHEMGLPCYHCERSVDCGWRKPE